MLLTANSPHLIRHAAENILPFGVHGAVRAKVVVAPHVRVVEPRVIVACVSDLVRGHRVVASARLGGIARAGHVAFSARQLVAVEGQSRVDAAPALSFFVSK